MKKTGMKILEYVKDLNWSARVGLFIVLFFAFYAIFAPWLAPYGESEIVGDVWEPIGGEFVFGTDIIGRDMLSRLIFGATKHNRTRTVDHTMFVHPRQYNGVRRRDKGRND